MHKIILIGLMLLLFGCASTPETGGGDIVEGTGTIQYIELEGGFYGLVDEDGQRYDPTNLDDAFKEDGLQVRFRAQRRPGMASIRMWGMIVEILSIERI